MLKSNSRKAIENIRRYILDGFTPYDVDFWDKIERNCKYPTTELNRFSCAAWEIWQCFYREKIKFDKRKLAEFDYFREWCQGLPSILDTCYYYNRSAVKDLGWILGENATEKARYTEEQAEEKLTWLIYREIKKMIH